MNAKSNKKKKQTSRWYVAHVLERFETKDEDRGNRKRRCVAYENVILIQAASAKEAYDKAIQFGKYHSPCVDSKGKMGKWILEGLTSLLPVYEDLEDGAEIEWIDHTGKSVSTIKRMVLTKRELLRDVKEWNGS